MAKGCVFCSLGDSIQLLRTRSDNTGLGTASCRPQPEIAIARARHFAGGVRQPIDDNRSKLVPARVGIATSRAERLGRNSVLGGLRFKMDRRAWRSTSWWMLWYSTNSHRANQKRIEQTGEDDTLTVVEDHSTRWTIRQALIDLTEFEATGTTCLSLR